MSRAAAEAYARIIALYLSGELSARQFTLVFMAMWGVLTPPSRGEVSDALHRLFALLEDLAIDAPVDEAATRAAVVALGMDWTRWREAGPGTREA